MTAEEPKLKLLTCNTSEYFLNIFKDEFILDFDESENPDAVFIEECSANLTPDDSSAFGKQTDLIELCLEKSIPTILYDKSGIFINDDLITLLTNREFFFVAGPYLSKNVDTLYFPLFNTKTEVPFRQTEKTIDLYLDPSKDYSNILVSSFSTSNNIEDCKYTIIYPTEEQIKAGYLENLSSYIDNYCIPLLWHEHRYYHALFSKWCVLHDTKQLEYLIRTYEIQDWALLLDLYNNVKLYFPEMIVHNFVRRLKDIYARCYIKE